MASAFNPALFPEDPLGNTDINPMFPDAGMIEDNQQEENLPRSWHPSPERSDDEETEDEEVKLNCMGGIHAYEESDMSSEEEDSDDADRSVEDGESPVEKIMKRSDVGVVHFVARQVDSPGSNSQIERPEPIVMHRAHDVDSDMDESDASSEGARGLGLSFGTNMTHEDDSSVLDTETSLGGEDVSVQVDTDESESELDSQESGHVDSGDDDQSDESVAASLSQDEFDDLETPAELKELESALINSEVEPDDVFREPTSPLSHAKRVLSSSALLGPSAAASDLTLESPKRMRCVPGTQAKFSLPPFTLGPTASGGVEVVAEDSTASESSDLEEEDQQLREELQDSGSDDDRPSTPIPLLTPAASPVHFDGDITICEWPSNLTVDTALTAAANLRPPSPSSLQTWEQQEEDRLWESKTMEKGCSSSLTPLIRGISVNLD